MNEDQEFQELDSDQEAPAQDLQDPGLLPPQMTMHFDTREHYLEKTIELTSGMLGILEFELRNSFEHGALTPVDVAHFTLTQHVLEQLQMGARGALQATAPDILVPDKGLVDEHGRPIGQEAGGEKHRQVRKPRLQA